MKYEEVVVAADDGFRAGGQSQFQVLVVLRISAIGDPRYGIKPYGRIA